MALRTPNSAPFAAMNLEEAADDQDPDEQCKELLGIERVCWTR